jgi:hypothetical protein
MTEWVSDCCGAEFDVLPVNFCSQCKDAKGLAKKPSIEVKEWDEYEVKGNPRHFTGNRFVNDLRSDIPADMEHLSALKDTWSNITISKRHVRQEITEWEDITKEELEK